MTWRFVSKKNENIPKPKCTTCFVPLEKWNSKTNCKCGAYLCKTCIGSKCI